MASIDHGNLTRSHPTRVRGLKFELEIFEVSPCTFPAYPQTEIAARQKDFESQQRANREALDKRKKEIKEKFKL